MKNKTVLLQEQLIIFSSIEEMKLDDIQKELGEFVASSDSKKDKRSIYRTEMEELSGYPSSGVSTYEFNEELFFKIKDFVKEVMKEEEFKPKEVIRDFRETASGNFSFKAGGGYTISDELVGGSGSSIMSRTFEAFLEYDKDRTEKK